MLDAFVGVWMCRQEVEAESIVTTRSESAEVNAGMRSCQPQPAAARRTLGDDIEKPHELLRPAGPALASLLFCSLQPF